MPEEQVLHYRIEQKLGTGGAGDVFLAHDERLDRPVALKFLPATDSVDASAALLAEARAASRLNHPNILTVYAVEQLQERSFLVMEYVQGSDLRTWMDSGPRELSQILRVAAQIASGLAAAHRAGVVHRDIKPENVHIGTDGRVRLLDFGLARILRTDTQMRSGEIRGTAPYMAPEQIQGMPADSRADLFSFGVLLYELLAGRRPFTGDYEPAVLYAILFAEPDDLRELEVRCTDELWQLVAHCLAKSPESRPQDSSQLASELERLASRAAAEIPGDSATAAPAALRKPASPLLGRDADWSRLLAHLDQAVSGRGFAVFLSGEAGIGKSRLMADVMIEARKRGLSVFSGAGLPQGGGMPYHPFTSALKKSYQRLDSRVLDGLCDRARAQGYDLKLRLPALRAFLHLEAGDPGLLNREQLWDAVLHLLSAMSRERPLLFVQDDLHWADRATLDLLAYLVRNLAGLPILFLCAWRTGEAPTSAPESGQLEQVVRQLRLERLAETIPLERLSVEQSADLARQLLNAQRIESSLLGWLVESAAGNPLFLAELVTWMQQSRIAEEVDGLWQKSSNSEQSPFPERVRDVIGARLESLDGSDRELLSVASCETLDFGSDALASCLGLSRLEILQRLQGLEHRHQLIRHEGNRYQFDHPLIKQILYDSLLPELRQEYHRLLAERLIAREGERSAQAARILHHLLAASLEVRAFPFMLDAGKRALEVFAVDEALTHFERAATLAAQMGQVEFASQAALLRGLGDARASSGDSGRALESFRQLIGLAEQEHHGTLLAEARRKAAEQLRIRGESQEALQLAETAVATALPDSQERVLALLELAYAHISRSEYERAIDASTRAAALASRMRDTGNHSVALSLLGLAHLHQGDFSSSSRFLQEAIALQRHMGDRKGLANSLNFLSLACSRTGEFELALDCQFEALGAKEKMGEIRAIPGSLNAIGDVYRDLGDLEQARDFHRRSLALARELGNVGSECDNVRDLGADDLLSGDLKSAERHLLEALKLSRDRHFPWYETRASISLAELELTQGDVPGAKTYLEAALALADKLGAQELLAEALRVSARLALVQGNRESALEQLTRALEVARQKGFRVLLLRLLGDWIQSHDALDPAAQEARREASELLGSMRSQFKNQSLLSVFESSDQVQRVARK